MVRLSSASLMVVFCAALSVPVASAQGPTPEQQKQHPQIIFEMTPARIEEAIAYAKREKNPDVSYPFIHGFGRIPAGVVTTPYTRVVAAASDAKRKYKEFTAADVTPEMIAPELHIYASSMQEGTTTHDVEMIVMLPKGEKDASAAVRPLRTSDIGETYKNLLGAEFEAKGMLAVFPLTMFVHDNQVRIVRRDWREIKARLVVKPTYK